MQNLAKDEAGNVWEVDAAGNPVRMVTPGTSGGRVFTLPQNPRDARSEARQTAAEARAEAAARRSDLEWRASHNPDGSAKNEEVAATRPETIAFYAQQVLAGAPMPALGMGKQATAARQAIMDEVARQAGARGLHGDDLARQVAHYKAGSKQLATLETMLGTIRQNEQTALANGQQFIDRSNELPGQTSMPLVNSIVQGAQRNLPVPGHAEIAAHDAAWNTFVNEYAKVVSGSPSGAGTMSDSARHEAMETMRGNYSQEQKAAAFQQMKADMANRINAIHSGINDAYTHLTQAPGYAVPETTTDLTIAQQREAKDAAAAAAAGSSGNGGGGAAPPPDASPTPPALSYTPATGKTHNVPDARTDAAVNAFINQGQWALANDTLRKAGFAPVSPAEQVAIQKWKKKYPKLSYNGTNVSNVEGLSTWQQMLSNPTVAPIAAGIAHYGNTATGGIPALLAGKEARGNLDVATAMNPKASLAGDVGGFITGSYGLGKLGKAVGLLKDASRAAPALADGIEAAPNLLARAGNGLRALSPDLVMGGSNGAAADPDHPILGGLEGIGGVLGGSAAGRYVLAPALRAASETRLGQALLGALTKPSAEAVAAADAAGTPPPTAFTPPPKIGVDERTLARSGAFEPGNVGNIRSQLQDAARLKMPMALADTDPRLRMIAGSASRLSPDVRALAENVLGTRAAGRTARATRLVDEHLAPTGNMADMQAANKKAAQVQSRALYEAAMGHPPVEDSALNELLNTPGGASAARHGYDYALNKGTSPGEMNMSIDPTTGQPRYDASLNWPTLQNIKIGMDANLEPFRSPLTGRLDIPHGSPAESLQALRARYNARLGELNSDYKAGNEAYAGTRAHGNAAQQGFDLARKMGTMNPDEVGNIARAVSPEHVPDFRQGVASHLADRITNTERDPYAILYGPDGAQQRLHAIFPEGAPEIGTANQLEDQFGLTRTELTGGSPTEPRRAADRLFKAGIGLGGLADGYALLHGVPPMATAAMTAGGLLARRMATHADTRLSMGMADKVGPQLLNIDPSANLDALDLLLQRYAARQAYNSQVNRAGAGAGAVLGGGAAAYGAGR